MAKPILVANWKNYPNSLAEAKELLKALGKKKDIYKKTRLYLAPPAVYFEAAAEKARQMGELAAQDYFAKSGTYTGTISSEMLKSFGVRLAIVGHSEQRALGETAETVAEKAKAALKAGIVPLVCFGEQVRDADGEHFRFLQEELKALLSGFTKKDIGKFMLAYEPLWAIGAKAKGPIDPAELSQTLLFVKKALADLFGRKEAEKVAILYGGSVDHTNAGILLRNSGAHGLLVGRASLNAQSFEGIARAITEK
jgi:triosephosphate isomerase